MTTSLLKRCSGVFCLCVCPVFFWRVFLSCSSVLVLSHQQVIRPWRKNIVGRRSMLSLLFLSSQAVPIVGGGKWHIEFAIFCSQNVHIVGGGKWHEFAISLQSNCTHCGLKKMCFESAISLQSNCTPTRPSELWRCWSTPPLAHLAWCVPTASGQRKPLWPAETLATRMACRCAARPLVT